MNKPFRFKQFSVYHDTCAMKVGTDGVLLGCWGPVSGKHILDIGTGSGLIALMMAQRNNHALIDAVELDPNSTSQAAQNFKSSPWHDRLRIIEGDIKKAALSKSYDIIISNPPFFTRSTKAPSKHRNNARHSDMLDAESLADIVSTKLIDSGFFNTIYPPQEGKLLTELMLNKGYYLHYLTYFIPSKDKEVERWLMSFCRQRAETVENELYHYNTDKKWSEDYINLTKDFYTVL